MGFVLLLFFGIMITGGIWMILKVFKDSTKAGLARLFIPFYGIGYLIDHWNEMKKPFYVWLTGAVGIAVILTLSNG